jgi:hypothetical protein
MDLGYIAFPSFSAFLQLIGAISSLEKLILEDIQWQSVCEPDQLPDCKAGFSNLKEVQCLGRMKPSAWPVVWTFAAAATGYSYLRRSIMARNPVAGIPPLDISVMARFVWSVLISSRRNQSPTFLLTKCLDKGTVIRSVLYFSHVLMLTILIL